MPYYPLEDEGGHNYAVGTWWEHLVSTYVGINMLEVEELDYLDYLQYRRDAFIYSLNQTEKGQTYLDNAYRLEQCDPDRQSLREQFGEGE